MARNVTAPGIDVMGIRDNPRFPLSMAECVVTKGAQDPACNPPRQTVMPADSGVQPAGGADSRADPAGHVRQPCICRPTCPAKVGNMFVYLDNNHLGATYAATMADLFETRLLEATRWQGR